MNEKNILRKIRGLIIFFIIALVLSGLTAFPLEYELFLVNNFFNTIGLTGPLVEWTTRVYSALHDTYSKYPFMAYGTDWLAFAHIVIAVIFIGPLRDPLKNVWVIQFGMIACILVIPLALIAGYIRAIPFYWRLIDCSFGVFGIIPLYICYRYIKIYELSK